MQVSICKSRSISMGKTAFSSPAADEYLGRDIFYGPSAEKRLEESTTAYVMKVNPKASKTPKPESWNNVQQTGCYVRIKSILREVLIAVTACVSLAWTLCLILLNITPNDTANWAMKTGSFDNGSFWLMADLPKEIMMASTFGLSIVAVGYLSVLLKIVSFPWPRKIVPIDHQAPSNVLMEKFWKILSKVADDRSRNRVSSSAAKMVLSLAHDDSVSRKRIVRTFSFSCSNDRDRLKLFLLQKLLLKFSDLALQTVLN
ncbi:unnamed protein product [Phytophthora fragariaefolia]|uniref:Unnamed protein product n=1 Tax=Phytophthora fragariaefolia TaxID=1490495 RepID=A0A9W6YP01_9STRA|nr:unnamed protein product [Phytophthora fragariaefolia]